MEKVKNLKSSNTAPSSETFRGECLFFIKHYYDQMKEEEMDETYSTHGSDEMLTKL
jgi:hypothetical protein